MSTIFKSLLTNPRDAISLASVMLYAFCSGDSVANAYCVQSIVDLNAPETGLSTKSAKTNAFNAGDLL
ncbi:hypothetical protein [Undibacterium sp.]|jgi:hypothetical protein|uniref:hypothetical protein n=1 Tax=Undibacterium sp. TaxID=1914977 RepID=UPI002C6453E5|nr:hypothetical protein [Undibacterium sp.]HTD04873.1 hypothetical protein [Undibacterium sp.]